MANTSGSKPSFTTSPSKAHKEVDLHVEEETNRSKLQRLKEENDVLREELVNIELRRKVEAARTQKN